MSKSVSLLPPLAWRDAHARARRYETGTIPFVHLLSDAARSPSRSAFSSASSSSLSSFYKPLTPPARLSQPRPSPSPLPPGDADIVDAWPFRLPNLHMHCVHAINPSLTFVGLPVTNTVSPAPLLPLPPAPAPSRSAPPPRRSSLTAPPSRRSRSRSPRPAIRPRRSTRLVHPEHLRALPPAPLLPRRSVRRRGGSRLPAARSSRRGSRARRLPPGRLASRARGRRRRSA